MDRLGSSGGGGRGRVRPRVLLLLLFAWLAMLLPALLAFQKHLACARGGCEQQGSVPVRLDVGGGLASRSAIETAASGSGGRSERGSSNSSSNSGSSADGSSNSTLPLSRDAQVR